MKKILSILVIGIAFQTSLQSEIEQITIRWTAQLCQGYCSTLLEREFRRIHGVNEIALDLQGGQANLTWKERVPFQFTSINTAMHMVGLSIRDIRIRVKGSIKHIGDTFFIISDGDNTRFDLVNPVIPQPGGQAAEFNAAARKITPALQRQLLDGETLKQIATIEGPVFMPERMTVPTQLVVDKLSFTLPADEGSKNK